MHHVGQTTIKTQWPTFNILTYYFCNLTLVGGSHRKGSIITQCSSWGMGVSPWGFGGALKKKRKPLTLNLCGWNECSILLRGLNVWLSKSVGELEGQSHEKLHCSLGTLTKWVHTLSWEWFSIDATLWQDDMGCHTSFAMLVMAELKKKSMKTLQKRADIL